MLSVTKQKPWEEISHSLDRHQSVYIIGCGTCTTIQHTGGKAEVLAAKEKLEAAGKKVTGWMVIPTTCDELTKYALKEKEKDIAAAEALLVMSCAFGVQMVSLNTSKPVYPAVNTLFMGMEEMPGQFATFCLQCGSCVLGRTAAICPLVRCAKSLLNGPCGGSVGGKCEIDPAVPCAWQLIVDRLAAQGQLDQLEEIEPPKDWSTSLSGGPRKITVEA